MNYYFYGVLCGALIVYGIVLFCCTLYLWNNRRSVWKMITEKEKP